MTTENNDANSGILYFPEYATLKETVAKLRTELSMLLLERDDLRYVRCKNIEMKYMLTLGGLEYKVFERTCQMRRLERKVVLLQQKINRQERISLAAIEAQLDEEFEAYQRQLEERVEKMNAALERDKGVLLSDSETKALKKLYRAIIKVLHPDLRPDITPALLALFQKAVTAYEHGDLVTMRIISEMVAEGNLPQPGEDALSVLMKEKERLTKMLAGIEAQITEIKENYPYTLGALIKDEETIAENKAVLETQLAQLDEIIARYTARISEMIGGHHE